MIIILPAGGFAECSVCLILAVSFLKEVVVLHQKLVQGGLGAAKLSADLDAGTYECTALFYNVDPDSGEYLGCAGAVITVTVLE